MKIPDQKLGHNTAGYLYALEAEGNGTIHQKIKRFQEAAKNQSFAGPELTESSDMAPESKEIVCFLYARKHLCVHPL